MTKKFAVALEIGSSKLRVTVGKEGLNNTISVIDNSEKLYDGYFQGEFVDFDKLKLALTELFDNIDYIKKKYNKKLYVGLPAEFIGVEVIKTDLNFDGYKKVRQSDINALYKDAASKIDGENIEIISTSATQFSIDDGGRLLSDPINKKAKNISAEVSVVVAEKAAIEKLNNIFRDLGFDQVEYVSETLHSALIVIPKEEREHECLFIDAGHLSTSVSIIKGEGIVYLTPYSLGGGYISSDLSEEFNLSYKDADKLKKMMVISKRGDVSECIDLPTDAGTVRISRNNANKIAINRLDEIGRAINQCINTHFTDYVTFLPVYLVGEAITKLKGGRDYLSKCIARNIIIGAPDIPGLDKPENSSVLGILNYALKKED